MTRIPDAAVRDTLQEARTLMPSKTSSWPVSVALLSQTGHVLAQVQPSPLHATVLESVLRTRLAQNGQPEWRTGQLYLSNDPYGGGLGLETIVMLAPVFSTDRLAGFAGAAIVVSDIGAMRSGIFAFGRQIMHEGVRLQGLDFVLEDGRLPEPLRSFLEANTRASAVMIPALEALGPILLNTSSGSFQEAVVEESLPALVQGRGGSARDFGARIALNISHRAGVIHVAVEDAAMDPEGLNSPLEATRAGILTALGEAAEMALWRVGRYAEIFVPAGSRFNPTYPFAVNLAGEGAWLAYRATADALGRTPALSAKYFIPMRTVPPHS